jgi:hypothetical protein
MSDVKPEDFLFELLEKEQKQNKKLSWHLIHTKANWIEKGAQREQERIIKLLEPLAECDKEVCGTDGETHYGLDCDAFSFQYAINLIKGEQK